MSDCSIVYWYPEMESHVCGYCKSEKGNVSYGMWAEILTVEDYQNLIDRGWRRSGNYCYKPLMDQICCPMYTIKCEALHFRLSKSQKKVIKKFNKFLKDGQLSYPDLQNQDDSIENISEFVYRDAPEHLKHENVVDTNMVIEHSDRIAGNIHQEAPLLSSKSNETSSYLECKPKNGVGADPNKPPCKKAKVLRMERKKEKLLKHGKQLEKIQMKTDQKSLEEFLNETTNDGQHKFKLELIHTGSNSPDWERLKKIEFALYKKYQMVVHNDPPEKCKMDGFLRFLVTSPLQYVKFNGNTNLGFGSFHQLYWLDDKLIAVGVIDILPKCVSAVYFFYDPDYRNLTLGTYGSLREIEFTRSLNQIIPSIQNYYMGFYIHSCPKMRYKGKLSPSLLLCPETYNWSPIEHCLVKLDMKKYSRLDEDNTAIDQNACSSQDVDEMKILIKRKLVLYKQYKKKYSGHDMSIVGRLVGQKCSKSLIFFGDE